MATVSINMTFAGKPLVQADPSQYPRAAELANGYTCPLGPGPGIGYVLLNRRHWDQIQANRYSAFPLVMRTGGTTATFPALRIVSAVKVSGGPVNDLNAVYMLKLADKRWHARMSDVAQQINVRCPAPPATTGTSLYYQDSLNAGALYTWTTACEAIWGAVPGFGTFPGLPYTPHGDPEGFQFIGVRAIDALSTMLERIGCTVAYNPLTDALSIVRLGSTQSGLAAAIAANQLYLADAEPFGVVQSLVPATIRVYFHGRDVHYGSEKFTQRASGNWVTENAWHKIDKPTGLAGTIANSVVSLWDDLPALFAFDGTISNASELDARATERALNYVADATEGASRFRRLYSGVVTNILPGSQITSVQWRNVDSRTNAESLVTEVMNRPGVPALADAATGMERERGDGDVADEALESPDLARHSYPNFPPLMQLVAFDGSGGALTASSGGNVWPGHVYRTNPAGNFGNVDNPYEAAETCWLALVNRLTGGFISGMKLAAGDRFLARLNGSLDVGGDVRPLYEIIRPENLIFAVTLATSLASGASVAVTLSDGRSVNATNHTPDTLAAGAATCYQDVPTSTFKLTGAGSGGGITPGVNLYEGFLTNGLYYVDATAAVNTVTNVRTGVVDAAITSVRNPMGLRGFIGARCKIIETLGIGPPDYLLVAVDPLHVARIIEGYVYESFTTSHDQFRGRITHAFDGEWPATTAGGAVDTLMIFNVDREGVDPHGRGPYLFEGEYGARFSADYDPEFSDELSEATGLRVHVYNTRYVECPEVSPVETSPGAGMSQFAGSDLYSQGGQPSSMAAAYFGG